MYTIHSYGEMISDHGRTDAYARALRARVTPDSVVLDIGAGPGILTLLACQAGARKVYALEPDGAIQIAREVVAANGFSDRVEFIQALSTDISLPEKVDVIVSDIGGVLPFFSGCIASIIDARERFLKPGGFLIPEKDTLWVALANSPTLYQTTVGPWEESFGLDWRVARQRAVNTTRKWKPYTGSLLGDPRLCSILDYRELRSPNAAGQAGWTIMQAAEAHGLCMWIDCQKAAGYGFSNSPLSGEQHIHGQAFLPWPQACPLEPGDHVAVDFRADQVGQDYVWSWNTEIRRQDGRGPIKERFRQSTFLGAPVSVDWLRKCSSDFVPSPNTRASIDRMILELFDAGLSLEQISRQVAQRFPERFPEWRNALTLVGEMSLRYSK